MSTHAPPWPCVNWQGSVYAEELLQEIEVTQLPKRLGGELDDGVQWARLKR